MTNLYIPKKIRVGFQQRKDTFTGKLAFIVYFDNLIGILMHSDVSKRDIVEECVFDWSGNKLILSCLSVKPSPLGRRCKLV